MRLTKKEKNQIHDSIIKNRFKKFDFDWLVYPKHYGQLKWDYNRPEPYFEVTQTFTTKTAEFYKGRRIHYQTLMKQDFTQDHSQRIYDVIVHKNTGAFFSFEIVLPDQDHYITTYGSPKINSRGRISHMAYHDVKVHYDMDISENESFSTWLGTISEYEKLKSHYDNLKDAWNDIHATDELFQNDVFALSSSIVNSDFYQNIGDRDFTSDEHSKLSYGVSERLDLILEEVNKLEKNVGQEIATTEQQLAVQALRNQTEIIKTLTKNASNTEIRQYALASVSLFFPIYNLAKEYLPAKIADMIVDVIIFVVDLLTSLL